MRAAGTIAHPARRAQRTVPIRTPDDNARRFGGELSLCLGDVGQEKNPPRAVVRRFDCARTRNLCELQPNGQGYPILIELFGSRLLCRKFFIIRDLRRFHYDACPTFSSHASTAVPLCNENHARLASDFRSFSVTASALRTDEWRTRRGARYHPRASACRPVGVERRSH